MTDLMKEFVAAMADEHFARDTRWTACVQIAAAAMRLAISEREPAPAPAEAPADVVQFPVPPSIPSPSQHLDNLLEQGARLAETMPLPADIGQGIREVLAKLERWKTVDPAEVLAMNTRPREAEPLPTAAPTVHIAKGTCRIIDLVDGTFDVEQFDGTEWSQIAGHVNDATAQGVAHRRHKEAGLPFGDIARVSLPQPSSVHTDEPPTGARRLVTMPDVPGTSSSWYLVEQYDGAGNWQSVHAGWSYEVAVRVRDGELAGDPQPVTVPPVVLDEPENCPACMSRVKSVHWPVDGATCTHAWHTGGKPAPIELPGAAGTLALTHRGLIVPHSGPQTFAAVVEQLAKSGMDFASLNRALNGVSESNGIKTTVLAELRVLARGSKDAMQATVDLINDRERNEWNQQLVEIILGKLTTALENFEK